MADGGLAHFEIPWGYQLDPLSAVMILVVTGVGFLIHVYSTGYMWEESGYYRFFSYLNLFMFAMLTLVLANNFAADVRRMGRGRTLLLSADRLLFREEERRGRREEGLHRQPNRRRRISSSA